MKETIFFLFPLALSIPFWLLGHRSFRRASGMLSDSIDRELNAQKAYRDAQRLWAEAMGARERGAS
jgi:hypothetical protein